MLLHLTWNWSRSVQEGCRWYHWSNETERFCDWMATSIPQVFNVSKSCSNITRSVLAEADTTIFNKELWKKNMKKFYEAVKQVFDVLMKEEILTKWLGQSSYIILFQTKWHPALNQTARCTFWGMGATITSNFVKSVSQKKKRSMVTL